MTKRNGKIEILRFLFCISVLLFHAGSDVLGGDKMITEHLSFFEKGRTGVEFFFIVSGFLAAKSAFKLKNSKSSIGNDTFNFIFGKIKTILPYHIFAVAGSAILLAVYSNNFISDFIKRVPSIFFLQRTGISNRDFISVEWYICSMLLALAIIYPLLRKNFDLTTLVLSPVLSSLMIGYLVKTYGAMPMSNQYDRFTYSCNIRAIALVLLGCFCFAVSEKIKKINFTKIQKIILITVENACWIVSLYFMVSTIRRFYESYVIYFMALGVTLTFSRDLNSKLYNNKFVYYLGKLSLPIYLCQNIARDIVRNELSFLSPAVRILAIALLAVAIGVAVSTVCDIFTVLKKKKASVNNS